MPVEADGAVPFPVLREFRAHEHEFFPGHGVGQGQPGPQGSEPLPVIPRNLVGHGALTDGDMIVGNRQHEMLVEGEIQGIDQLIVIILAVHGMTAQITQGVVSPRGVPTQTETQAPILHGRGDPLAQG